MNRPCQAQPQNFTELCKEACATLYPVRNVNKTQINLSLLLPHAPDERDACVTRIIGALEAKKGIDKVHIKSAVNGTPARLCFHYNPELISIREVNQMAAKEGAAITEKFGHILIEVGGIRQPRHARILEERIQGLQGVQSCSVSATGFIQLEFDKSQTTEPAVLEGIEKMKLTIKNAEALNDGHGEEPHAKACSHEEAGPKTRDEQHNHGHCCHDRVHDGIFGERTEMIFSIICGVFLTAGFAASFVTSWHPMVSVSLYLVAYFFGGFFTGKEAFEGIRRGRFEIDFLMLVAAIGAAALGQWGEGALLLFLFSLGHALEHYAMQKARKSIAALANLTPKTALRKNREHLEEVAIESLRIGDVIVIRPNTTIAADAVLVQGSGHVNEAPITGESIPADKEPLPAGKATATPDKLDRKYRLFAGAINGNQQLEARVSRLSADSTIARLIKLVNEAQTQKSPTQHLTDKIERFYVPAVLVLVGLLLLAFLVLDEPFSASFYRAMAVLVAASPCALAISTPSAVLSGVARAARGGVLVKGGRPLEELGGISAVAFDKTGTLTAGKPHLTGVYPSAGVSETELLEKVIAVEHLSDHPLAAAIVADGEKMLGYPVAPAHDLVAITARGVRAVHEDETIFIGNPALFREEHFTLDSALLSEVDRLESAGNTTMLAGSNGKILGIIALMDVARQDAKTTLQQLRSLGVKQMVMLTGDNQKVADAIARETGLTQAWGGLLPEEKVSAVEQLKQQYGRVAMVGDGVNDAPALAKSTVGIAMGAAGSDVALETADVALMADKLHVLPFAIGLSRQAHRIIRQNLVISMGMIAILVPLTITGYAHIGPAVVGHEGSTLLVVFNALRLLGYKKPKTEAVG